MIEEAAIDFLIKQAQLLYTTRIARHIVVGVSAWGGNMGEVSHRNQQYDATDWVQVMLTIDRPTPERLAGCDRKEKFDILLENAQRKRAQLVQWIQEHDLANEVARVGAPTSFNLLFVQCTPYAATQLAHAPGVVKVALEQEHTPLRR